MQGAETAVPAQAGSLPLAVLPEIDATLGKCLTLFASQTAFTISSCRLPDMPIIYASPQFCTMTGFSAKEVLGRNCRFLQGPGTSRQSVLEIRSSIQEDRGCTVCLLNYTKQGKPFWNQLCLSPIADQHGIAYYLGIQTNVSAAVLAYRSQMYSPFRVPPPGPHGGVHSFDGCPDITAKEVKLAEVLGSKIRRWHSDKSLGNSLARKDFRAVSSALLPASLLGPLYKLLHSFCLVDPSLPDMPIVHASEGFLRLTGRPRNQVVGYNCRFMQGSGTQREELDRLRAAVGEERPVSVSLLNYRHDGTAFWNHLHIAPIRNADGQVAFFVGVQLDITQTSAAESHPGKAGVEASQPVNGSHVTAPQLGRKDSNVEAEPPSQQSAGKASVPQANGLVQLAEGMQDGLDLVSTASRVSSEKSGPAGIECRQSIAPQEKQAQRSIVGKVRVVCRSLSAKSGLRRSFQDQHRPHADELAIVDGPNPGPAASNRLDTPSMGSSHL